MDKQEIEVRDALLKRITKLEDENKNLKFRLFNVSGELFCKCERHNPYNGVKFNFDIKCTECSRIIKQNNFR